MSARILLSGTIGIDTIITPTDRADSVLGGSACFAGVAARLFADSVDILSIIGNDFPGDWMESLERQHVNLDHVVRYQGPSFAWTGEYYDNMNKRRTVSAKDEVMVNWEVDVPEVLRDHPVIVASCMVPARQLQFLNQCRNPRLVLTDSMDKWITRQPEMLDAVMHLSHIALMNEDEAKGYAHTDSLLEAGEHILSLGPAFAIIKQGEYGASLFARNARGGLRLFRCPAWPLRSVVDPTGAGDTFLGALSGYLACLPDLTPSFDDVKRGIVHATVAASFTCESFSADALFTMDRKCFDERLTEYRAMTRWDW